MKILRVIATGAAVLIAFSLMTGTALAGPGPNGGGGGNVKAAKQKNVQVAVQDAEINQANIGSTGDVKCLALCQSGDLEQTNVGVIDQEIDQESDQEIEQNDYTFIGFGGISMSSFSGGGGGGGSLKLAEQTSVQIADQDAEVNQVNYGSTGDVKCFTLCQSGDLEQTNVAVIGQEIDQESDQEIEQNDWFIFGGGGGVLTE